MTLIRSETVLDLALSFYFYLQFLFTQVRIPVTNFLYRLTNQSFNPMCEPCDEWSCKYDDTPEQQQRSMTPDDAQSVDRLAGSTESTGKCGDDFSFQCGRSLSEDDDEVTESKIKAFLDEKVAS